MENKKYKLDTEDTITVRGETLYRIIALRDIGDMVKAGDKGGYIARGARLSHEGLCWIGDEAKVCQTASVFDDAQVFGRAEVYGFTGIFNTAMVYGDARIDGTEFIRGDAQIWSNVAITDEEYEQATNDANGELKTEDLLNELKSRGGVLAALAEAGLLYLKKSADYNGDGIDSSEYFPFGALSYAQMLHVKATRFNALARKDFAGGDVNFEGQRDTALDIINYAAMYVASVTLYLPKE